MSSPDPPTTRTYSSHALRCASLADGADCPTSVSVGAALVQTPFPEFRDPTLPRVRGYELLAHIGSGGMGVVYKARHAVLQRTVALKMLHGAAAADHGVHERFHAEAEAVARLQHPNIIQVFEIGSVQPQHGEVRPSPFIALEFMEGGSLARFTDSPQTPEFAARMVEKLARGAHAAHRVGVVHRDLKPANVLLTREGEPKIADFGVAKLIDSGPRFLTQVGMAVGTPEYMAPEQVMGEEPTSSIDVYALGVILYQLLTARVPFQGANAADTMYLVCHQEPVSPRRLQPGLSRDLETICLKCLAKSTGRRYESAAALADDLARLLDRRTIHARPVGAVERAVRWSRRNPIVAGLSAAVVLVSMIGLTGVVWKWREAETQARAATEAAITATERENAERWERYRADVLAASSALKLYDAGAARRALDPAPADHRNWEWNRFARELDTSRDTLGGDGNQVHWVLMPRGADRVFTLDDDETMRVWDVPGRRLLHRTNNVPARGRSTISPDGSFVMYTIHEPDDNHVVLLDLATNRIRLVLRADAPFSSVRASPDGKRVAGASHDGTVHLWDAVTGVELRRWRPHRSSCGVSFSPDGRRLATMGGPDRSARVWDVETGALVFERTGHSSNVDHVEFNPAGDRMLLVSLFPSNCVWLWDVEAGTLLVKKTLHKNQIRWAGFSPDGRRFATASMDQTVQLWDGRTGAPIARLRGHNGWVNHVSFSPDGRRLITASQDKTVRIWDAGDGDPRGVLLGHAAEVLKAEYTADGTTIVSASRDRTVKVWDARQAESENAFRGHTDFIYGVAFHPDGERVASASWDGSVRVWHATTGRELARYDTDPKAIVSSVAFHPGGKYLASLARDGAVRLYDLDANREVHRWPVPPVRWQDARLAFSPDGSVLAFGADDFSVRLLDVANRTELAILRGHTDVARDVAFTPDGRRLASCSDKGEQLIRVWDVRTGEQLQALTGHTDSVYSLAFNGTGTLLASGSTDGTVRLWDTSDWREAAVLKHGTNVYGLAFTPDGSRLASACADDTIRLWDVATRQEVADLHGHTDYIHSIAFSPDGTRLVSGSGDATVRIWDTLPARKRGR